MALITLVDLGMVTPRTRFLMIEKGLAREVDDGR